MHAEKLGNMASAVSTGEEGVEELRFLLLLLLPVLARARAARFPMSIASIALLYSTDRDYVGSVNGSDRKGYGFVEISRVISMMAVFFQSARFTFRANVIERLEAVTR